MDDDSTLTLHVRADALDELPFGVLRLGLDGRIRYVNREAARLAGPEMHPGAALRAMPFEAESVARLDSEIRRRHRAQRASSYPLTLNRPDLGAGVRVHLKVVGLPEYDAAGALIGSLGFIEDCTLERAALAIHEAIGVADDCEPLLDSLAAQLDEVMHFDAMLVSMISEDRSAVRLLHSRPAAAVSPTWGWWPMPEMVRADLDQLAEARVDAVAGLFAREPYVGLARHDVATRDFIAAGWRHMLRRPVFRDGALAAILTLLRREDRPFDDDDAARATQLPIAEAVNVALALDRQRALEFELELIGNMGQAAGNLSDVACVLVEGLRCTRGWDHVSLFRVDHDEGLVSLVHQSAAPGAELPAGYRQPLGAGVLGEVALWGRAVRLGDVRTSARYTAGVSGTVSEMCLPVPGQPVRWILNLESSRSNAFAAAEQSSIERTLKVAGLILDRSWALEFNTAVLDTVADAVIQTTARGEIQAVNPACEALTGLAREALIGRQLSELLSAPGHDADPPGYAERLVGMPRLLSSEVELLAHDGTHVPVLLSGASLPPQIGGKVYVASDLRFRREAQRMDSLRHVYSQVANEIRVPLSLASTYLREHTLGDAGGTDVLDKALRQLVRADVSLERVARLASTPEDGELPLRVVSLDQLAAQLHDDLPRRQQKTVDVLPDPLAPPVLAAPPELAFCASSLLAFLLRMRAQDDRIRIRVDASHAQPRLCFELADGRGDPSPTRLVPRSDEEREFALAEGVLRTLMRRMRGQLVMQQHAGLSLALRLSVAQGA